MPIPKIISTEFFVNDIESEEYIEYEIDEDPYQIDSDNPHDRDLTDMYELFNTIIIDYANSGLFNIDIDFFINEVCYICDIVYNSFLLINMHYYNEDDYERILNLSNKHLSADRFNVIINEIVDIATRQFNNVIDENEIENYLQIFNKCIQEVRASINI